MNREQYILKTGESGEAQLDALDRTFGIESRKFLQQLEIEKCQYVADIGCGSGNLSLWMAEQIDPYKGRVIGVDNNEDQIRVARRRAQERGIQNVEFIVLSAYDLSTLPKNFDLVYCRWLLVHLDNPKKAIQQMSDRVHQNGVLAFEETTGTESRLSYPNHEFIGILWGWVYNILTLKGCDIEIGMHLFQMMQDFPNFQSMMQFNQIVITEIDEIHDHFKRLKTVLISMKPAILQYDQASAEQIDTLIKQLETVEPQQGDFIAYDRMTQLWAKRIK
jgi:ubiquinone/menaquinone biosynthesis C-methylase UbiE